jgi:Short-chain alcohol dehydrogenase of unknown specificity
MKLKGKHVLITGGNSGIGPATARLFVGAGARVAITGRNEKTLNVAADPLGRETLVIRNAVPSPLGPVDPVQRNKIKLGFSWNGIQALFRGLFAAPSTQDLKPRSSVSVILTPAGLLVYQWQIDYSGVMAVSRSRDV